MASSHSFDVARLQGKVQGMRAGRSAWQAATAAACEFVPARAEDLMSCIPAEILERDGGVFAEEADPDPEEEEPRGGAGGGDGDAPDSDDPLGADDADALCAELGCEGDAAGAWRRRGGAARDARRAAEGGAPSFRPCACAWPSVVWSFCTLGLRV
jgi:hypothetical protein